MLEDIVEEISKKTIGREMRNRKEKNKKIKQLIHEVQHPIKIILEKKIKERKLSNK